MLFIYLVFAMAALGIFVLFADQIRTGRVRIVHRPADKYAYDVETKRVIGWKIESSFANQPAAEEFMVKYRAGTAVPSRGGLSVGTVIVDMKD